MKDTQTKSRCNEFKYSNKIKHFHYKYFVNTKILFNITTK